MILGLLLIVVAVFAGWLLLTGRLTALLSKKAAPNG